MLPQAADNLAPSSLHALRQLSQLLLILELLTQLLNLLLDRLPRRLLPLCLLFARVGVLCCFGGRVGEPVVGLAEGF